MSKESELTSEILKGWRGLGSKAKLNAMGGAEWDGMERGDKEGEGIK